MKTLSHLHLYKGEREHEHQGSHRENQKCSLGILRTHIYEVFIFCSSYLHTKTGLGAGE